MSASPAPQPSAAAGGRLNTQPSRILLVDDHRVDQLAFKRMVTTEGLGYDYRIAGSVAEAGRLLTAELFDIVVTDYYLGDGTAFDLFDTILASGLPIVVATALGDATVAVKAMKLGAADYLVKDAERRYLQVLPTAIDKAIQRKRLDTAQRERQELYRLITDNANDLISLTDMDGRLVYISPSVSHILGYAPEQLIGTPALERREPGEGAADDYLAQLQSGMAPPATFRIRHADGSWRWLESNGGLVERGGRQYVLTVARDITQRNQIAQTLAHERDQLQALMDNVPDTIYFKDLASRFTRINWSEARLLGLATPELAVGKTDADFQPPQRAGESLAEEQRLFGSGEPLVDRLEFNPTPGGQPRWLSSTKVPLKDASGQVVGLVGISRDITTRINAEEVLRRQAELLASRVSELLLLGKLDEELKTCQTTEETFPVAVRVMSQLSPSLAGGLYVAQAGQAQLTTAASWGAPPLGEQSFAPDDCFALSQRQLYFVDPAHPGGLCRHAQDAPLAAALCLPLMAQGQALGVLHLRATEAVAPFFDAATRQFVQVVADSLALTWANLSLRENLRQQAIRDGLTGLFNRRFMQESLSREVHRAARAGQSIGVIMMDVDDFKLVNDRLGHEAGDMVLRELSQLLQSYCRASDIACRFGGEEFLLILPDASLQLASERAEQLRLSFQQMDFGIDGDQLGAISLSLGVAAFPQHGDDWEAVLRAADQALYQAKHLGKDRTSVAPSSGHIR